MSIINARELRKRFEMDGAERTVSHLTEALRQGELKPEEFSLRDLAESFIAGGAERLTESTDPLLEEAAIPMVNIVGAVIETKIRDSYNQEVFAVSKLVKTIQTRLDGEKIHTFNSVPDVSIELSPCTEYPTALFGADYIETPSTSKRGLVVPVTKEAIFFDQTHYVLERAAEVGEVLALNKERRILDMILGITNTYKLNGVAKNTYYAGASGDPWKNLLVSNELTNWESIEAAEDVFGAMTDPSTGDPILIEPNTVLVMPPKRHLAHRLFYASSISYEDTVSNTVSTVHSPFQKYKLISSRLAYQRLQSQSGITNPEKIWIIGNFKKAFAYMENWGITVSRSLPGSEMDFSNDVVVRFKASERGVPAVIDPRYAVKCTFGGNGE